ncbi:hypothetical protein EXU32_15185 [Janibacter limosus]|uniref:Uncharacterized protein n=1 Tax=Janibacter limosus TaxID=53458 RepID=A0A4P6MZC8_9MICO|nr:hypothetical protein EXU32_15185 [Janibacter limosus]
MLRSAMLGPYCEWCRYVRRHDDEGECPLVCRPVRCQQCGKTTWSGCGEHVADVRAQIPAANWCQCPENADPRA